MKFNTINVQQAFTLMETLLSLTLLSIMLSLYIPGLYQALQNVHHSKLDAYRWELARQLVIFHEQYPDTLQDGYTPFLQQYMTNTHDASPRYALSETRVVLTFSDGEVISFENN